MLNKNLYFKWTSDFIYAPHLTDLFIQTTIYQVSTPHIILGVREIAVNKTIKISTLTYRLTTEKAKRRPPPPPKVKCPVAKVFGLS